MICQINERIQPPSLLGDSAEVVLQNLKKRLLESTGKKEAARKEGWVIPFRGTIEGAIERWIDSVDINPKTGCWEWRYALRKPTIKNNKMYPHLRYKGTRYRVHRFAYQLVFGSIPDGMLACHRCDNEKCSNPEHIFIGTQLDNVRDCIAKGRSRRLCSKNKMESNPNAKITLEIAEKIRSEYKWRVVTARMLAQKYGLSRSATWAVCVGRRWVSK